jgi:zinc transport system substrate-binding protein
MKRILVVLLAVFMLAGCNQGSENNNGEAAEAEKIKIVATIFPQYDWVREIIGELDYPFELTLLVDSNIDFHSFQPSVSDIAKISSADLFIYVGGHSDTWVENALKQATNPDLIAVSLVEMLGDAVKTERLSEGMVHDCDDPDCDDEHHDEEIPELNEEEHVWTSLRNAMILCEKIAENIIALNPQNADFYRENLNAYTEKLSALDMQYSEAADSASVKTLVFGDRFPFLYLVDDYGIEFYAAFTGCSAAAEASFSTIITLARVIDDYELRYIMVTESPIAGIAETIISNTKNQDQQILSLNGMKGITSSDIQNGVTYFSIMEENLEVLREALS